mmetsp:Transcript_17118/g.48205  ORF Transcript_17118/g.48205 Transcript_17118/m.48205 type:complete len:218 (+) Transcript_17118:189-842(+)
MAWCWVWTLWRPRWRSPPWRLRWAWARAWGPCGCASSGRCGSCARRCCAARSRLLPAWPSDCRPGTPRPRPCAKESTAESDLTERHLLSRPSLPVILGMLVVTVRSLRPARARALLPALLLYGVSPGRLGKAQPRHACPVQLSFYPPGETGGGAAQSLQHCFGARTPSPAPLQGPGQETDLQPELRALWRRQRSLGAAKQLLEGGPGGVRDPSHDAG